MKNMDNSFRAYLWLKIIGILFLGITLNEANCQQITRQLISPSGISFHSDGLTLSMSFGETAIESVETPGIKLLQGFQQSIIDEVLPVYDIAGNGIQAFIYPNPVDQLLHIQFKNISNTGPVSISITNGVGQVILEKTIKSGKGIAHELLTVSHLKPGIYFLKLYKTPTDSLFISKFTKI